MAAQAYGGELTVTEALTSVLNNFVSLVASSAPRVYVLNPANPREDLSERWNDTARYRAFVDGISKFRERWSKALAANGIHKISNELEVLFGEPVKTEINRQARAVQDLREKSALRVAATGILTSAATRSVPVRANTFHGKR
jgi:hypothetical protein